MAPITWRSMLPNISSPDLSGAVKTLNLAANQAQDLIQKGTDMNTMRLNDQAKAAEEQLISQMRSKYGDLGSLHGVKDQFTDAATIRGQVDQSIADRINTDNISRCLYRSDRLNEGPALQQSRCSR